MKKIDSGLRIKEMAKLCNTTVDTLRFYDKIDLFKPLYTNEKTGYRYYSVLQYEMLGTILELRQIGLSIDEIQDYMQNRNVKQSLVLLDSTLQKIQYQINDLTRMSKTLEKRIHTIKEFEEAYTNSHFIIRNFKKRFYVYKEEQLSIENEEQLSLNILELGHKLHSNIPFLANSTIGHRLIQSDFQEVKQMSFVQHLPKNNYERELFILVDEDTFNGSYTKAIPAGDFVCSYYIGLTTIERLRCLQRILLYCEQQGYEIIGDAINIIQIDISLTNDLDEVKCEIQVPIKSPQN